MIVRLGAAHVSLKDFDIFFQINWRLLIHDVVDDPHSTIRKHIFSNPSLEMLELEETAKSYMIVDEDEQIIATTRAVHFRRDFLHIEIDEPGNDNLFFLPHAVAWAERFFGAKLVWINGLEVIPDEIADKQLPEFPPRPGADGYTWNDVFDWMWRQTRKITNKDIADSLGYSERHVETERGKYKAQFGDAAMPDDKSKFCSEKPK